MKKKRRKRWRKKRRDQIEPKGERERIEPKRIICLCADAYDDASILGLR